MKWETRGIKYDKGMLVIPCDHIEVVEKELYSVEVKKKRKSRSTNANAYAWAMIEDLAKVLNIGRIELYKRAIQEAGLCNIVTIPDEAVDKFIEHWKGNGIGWQVEYISNAYGFTDLRVFFGSSVYNTTEMVRLIEWLVQECDQQGIEVKEQ